MSSYNKGKKKNQADSLDRLTDLGKLKKEKMEVANNVRLFLQRNGAYNQLQALVNVFAPTKRKDLTLRVNVGGGSYTDGKVVVVGLFDSMWKMKKHEIFSGLKALTAHEVGHVLHSDFEAFKEFQEKVAEYFQSNHGIDPKISKEIARGIANSIEDGRIERLMGQSFRGIVPNIQFMRSCWWEEQALPEDQPLPQFSVWSTCVLTLATTGLWPKGMDIETYEEAYQETLKVLPWIQAGILSNDPKECLDYCWEIILQCEDFILKEIEATQNFMDLLNALMSAQTSQFENERDQSGDGESQMDENEGGSGTHIDPRLISSESLKELSKHMKSKPQKGNDSGSSSGMNSSEQTTDEKEEEGNGSGSSSKKEEGEEQASASDQGDGEEMSSSNQEGEEGSTSGQDGKEENNQSSNEGDSSDQSQPSENNPSNAKEDLSRKQSHENFTKEMVSQEEVRPASQEAYDAMVEELRKRHEESAQKDVESAEKFDESEEKIQQAREEKERREQAKIEQTLNEIKKQFKGDFSFNKLPFEAKKVRLPAEIITKGKMLHNHFQTILDQDPEEDFARYKKGSLDTGALWRVSTNEKRLFNRREPDVHTCAVSLLIDGSGSMNSRTRYYDESSTRFKDALRAGAIIEEALRGLVPLDITVFTTGYSEVSHFPLKGFDDKSDINHCWSFYQHGDGPFWGNADGYSIAIVGDELKKRPEDQKILFVISDGLPAFSDGVEETRNAVRNLKQAGVKVIGIGVGEEALNSQTDFLRMYEKQSVLIETEKITDYLIRYLSKLLA